MTAKTRCPADLLVAMTENERTYLLSAVVGTVEAITVHTGGIMIQWKLDPARGWVRA